MRPVEALATYDKVTPFKECSCPLYQPGGAERPSYVLKGKRMKSGDVVLGPFATSDGAVLRHYSVVLAANQDGALLVYTTSVKEGLKGGLCQFTDKDRELANWPKPCRYEAATVCVVPASQLRKTGVITGATLGAIVKAYNKAVAQRSVQRMLVSEEGAAERV